MRAIAAPPVRRGTVIHAPSSRGDRGPDHGERRGGRRHLDGQYLKAGPNLGLSFRDHGRGTGLVAGVEGAYTFMRGPIWTGGTCELARDFTGADSTRWAIGPKLGYLFVGLDLRYAGERAAGATRSGVNLRLRLTTALGGLYLGGTRYFHDATPPCSRSASSSSSARGSRDRRDRGPPRCRAAIRPLATF